MSSQPLNLSAQVWKETLKVASAFWAVCLVLVSIEARFGANRITETVFFLSVPALVGYLMWANRDLLIRLRSSLLGVLLLGLYVLLCASVIVLVGLVAAVSLKSLIVGA